MSGTNSTVQSLPSAGFFIALIFFVFLFIVVGIIGNVGVIAYNVYMNHSKTPTTYFVVNLAISDVIVCLAFFPPWLVKYISIVADTEYNNRLICKFGMTCSCTSAALSIANLLAITADRYIFITKPLHYPRIMTWKITYALVVTIWVLALINASLLFFSTELTEGESLCKLRNPAQNVFLLINIILPSLGLFYFNYKIYKVAKYQRRKIRHESCSTSSTSGHEDQKPEAADKPQRPERKERLQQIKMMKTFAIVLGVFFGCTFPHLVIVILRENVCNAKLTSCQIPYSVLATIGMLAGANSAMNPFIYSLRNKEYRRAYRQLVSQLLRNS